MLLVRVLISPHNFVPPGAAPPTCKNETREEDEEEQRDARVLALPRWGLRPGDALIAPCVCDGTGADECAPAGLLRFCSRAVLRVTLRGGIKLS